jgi:serine/threonine protein kinase HipA of HipAB toxin-antitoxin module
VKVWGANEYPQLAANEYFCLTVARKYGLDVPPYRLAEDGMALVIDRFDLRMDGTYRGVEDFCVLNGRRADEKYRGSYETSVHEAIWAVCKLPDGRDSFTCPADTRTHRSCDCRDLEGSAGLH